MGDALGLMIYDRWLKDKEQIEPQRREGREGFFLLVLFLSWKNDPRIRTHQALTGGDIDYWLLIIVDWKDEEQIEPQRR